MNKVKITTRFGKVVEFTRKPVVFQQKAGERFTTALFRTYYPTEYAKQQRELKKGVVV
jgi:hypothetical protein